MKCKYGNEGIFCEIVDGELKFIDNKAPLEYYKSVDVFGNLVAWQPVLPNGMVTPSPIPLRKIGPRSSLMSTLHGTDL